VAEHRREVGIRLTLGAGRGRVLAGVLARAARSIVPGLALGMAGSFLAGRALQSQLFEVPAADPLRFAGAAALLGGVALLAALLPASRAAAVDPAETLRDA